MPAPGRDTRLRSQRLGMEIRDLDRRGGRVDLPQTPVPTVPVPGF